jgi:hypothetical protein
MVDLRVYRGVMLFLVLYVLLAWPPFLYLNREVLDAVLDQLAQLEPLTAVWFLGAIVVLSGLVRGQEGVDRYTQFISAPTDLVSMFVGASYLLAAISWWAIPELVFALDGDVSLNLLLLLVLACQLPMLVLLSLMTVVSKASSNKGATS